MSITVQGDGWDHQRFDGAIRSRDVMIGNKGGAEGEIDVGEYPNIPTDRAELVILKSGRLNVVFPNSAVYQYGPGQSFRIGAGTTFGLKVIEPVTYECIYDPDPPTSSGF